MLPIRNPLKNRLRVKTCNKIHMLTLIQRKPVSKLISDKADFRIKSINESKKDYFHIDNGVNYSREHSNPKCLCT